MKIRIYNFFSSRLVAYFSLLIILLQSCDQKDPDLYTPDINGHGYNLTALGFLVYSRWEYSKSLNGYNISIYLGEKTLSSTPYPYSEAEQKLLFKLYKNGEAKFMFKNDSSENEKNDMKKIIASDHKLSKEGNLGSWQANFTDSTLILNFDKNEYQLPPLKAKIGQLTGSLMKLEQISYFDSIYDNQKVILKKVITLEFQH